MVYISLGRRDNLAQHARPPCFFTCVLASFIGLNHGKACRNLPKSWYKLVKPSARGVSESWSQSERRCHGRAPDGQTTAGLAPKKMRIVTPIWNCNFVAKWGKTMGLYDKQWDLDGQTQLNKTCIVLVDVRPKPVSQVISHKEMIIGSTNVDQRIPGIYRHLATW
jgi:hypothetical protein